jgi:hypothetical protein
LVHSQSHVINERECAVRAVVMPLSIGVGAGEI